MEKFIFHDAETGGLYPRQHSLLTHYFAVATFNGSKFVVERELDLKIKPNADDFYKVTAGALKVNRIDLVKHDAAAITIDEAAKELYYFLRESSNDGRNRLCRVGHNEQFDTGFIVNHLLKEEIWRKFTDYHTLDTVPIARYLKLKGKLPASTKLNLERLAEHLNVSFSDITLHTAKGDTMLLIRVLEALLTL